MSGPRNGSHRGNTAGGPEEGLLLGLSEDLLARALLFSSADDACRLKAVCRCVLQHLRSKWCCWQAQQQQHVSCVCYFTAVQYCQHFPYQSPRFQFELFSSQTNSAWCLQEAGWFSQQARLLWAAPQGELAGTYQMDTFP